MQYVTWGPPEAGGYDQLKGWSDSVAKGTRPEPYGPPGGSLSDVEMLRLFQVWTSIFKFLMKRRWKNPFLRTKQTPRCSLMLPA